MGRSNGHISPSGGPSATTAEQMKAGAGNAGHSVLPPSADGSAGRIYKLSLTIPLASQMKSSMAVSDGWIQGHMVVLQLQGKLGKRVAGFCLGKARNPKWGIPEVSSTFRSTMPVVHLLIGSCSVP